MKDKVRLFATWRQLASLVLVLSSASLIVWGLSRLLGSQSGFANGNSVHQQVCERLADTTTTRSVVHIQRTSNNHTTTNSFVFHTRIDDRWVLDTTIDGVKRYSWDGEEFWYSGRARDVKALLLGPTAEALVDIWEELRAGCPNVTWQAGQPEDVGLERLGGCCGPWARATLPFSWVSTMDFYLGIDSQQRPAAFVLRWNGEVLRGQIGPHEENISLPNQAFEAQAPPFSLKDFDPRHALIYSGYIVPEGAIDEPQEP